MPLTSRCPVLSPFQSVVQSLKSIDTNELRTIIQWILVDTISRNIITALYDCYSHKFSISRDPNANDIQYNRDPYLQGDRHHLIGFYI